MRQIDMDCGFFLRSSWIIFILQCIGFAPAQNRALFEPPDGMIYHGVGWGGQAQVEYSAMFPNDHHPLLFQNVFSIPGGLRPLTVELLSGMLRPPYIDPDRQYAELSVHFADQDNALDSTFAYTDLYDHYIDTLSEALFLHDRPVFLRIGLEMNGEWNGYSPWIFPRAYCKLVDALRNRGVTDVAYVWCYEPDAPADFADSTEAGWKWYPGDDVVDWFGLDPFDVDHFDPILPDSIRGEITKKGRTEAFLQFAIERNKPVYLNELSARKVYITADADDPNHTDGKNDWETWFEPFFKFLDVHPSIKAFNYIDLEWTKIPQYADWGDARIQINTYIRDRWVARLAESRFLHIGTDIVNPCTKIDEDLSLLSQHPTKSKLTLHPNPFNETAFLTYFLPDNREIRIDVFNLLGQRLVTIYKGSQNAGNHRLLWNSSHLSSGIYLIVLQSNFGRVGQKAVIMR